MRGHVYHYQLEIGSLVETEAVIMTYEQAGWKLIKLEPDESCLPTHVVFEWCKDSPAIYPMVTGWK